MGNGTEVRRIKCVPYRYGKAWVLYERRNLVDVPTEDNIRHYIVRDQGVLR